MVRLPQNVKGIVLFDGPFGTGRWSNVQASNKKATTESLVTERCHWLSRYALFPVRVANT